mmetsp:Transcript_22986/g.42945  ORF Transcript_22986/g.42945 Transcript_22986/m.42945 type:complete len:334 (-) Transcript_22986:168-1169(-)
MGHDRAALRSAANQGDLECGNLDAEAPCEAAAGCYWATWQVEAGECLPVPSTSEECVCTFDRCGPDFLETDWDKPSGCEPTRFCQYNNPRCRLVLDVTSDDKCIEDGDLTMHCVPSEFCTAAEDAPQLPALFLDEHCVRNTDVSLFPTKAPTERTPTPTLSPTFSPTSSVESFDPDQALVVILGSAAGAAVLLAAALIYSSFCRPAKELSDDQLDIVKDLVARRKLKAELREKRNAQETAVPHDGTDSPQESTSPSQPVVEIQLDPPISLPREGNTAATVSKKKNKNKNKKQKPAYPARKSVITDAPFSWVEDPEDRFPSTSSDSSDQSDPIF